MLCILKNTGQSVLFDGKSRWDIPLLFLNYMYLIETLGNQSANNEVTDLCYKNISNGEYIDSSYKDVMIPFFLIRYLEYKFGNQENKNPTENLLKQKNKIFVDILMSDDVKKIYNSNPDPVGAKKRLLKQKTNDKNVGLLLYNIKDNWRQKFEGFYRFMIPKFWEIIDGLPEECIFVFVVEMMREVTLTRQQLDLVEGKVQNKTLRLYLEKFNYDPDYKKDKKNIIREGTKISWANYLCEKLFRGVGWLPGIILAAFLLALEILVAIAFAHWFITLCCIGAAFVIVKILVLDCMIRDKNSIFRKCVDFMQWAYDKNVRRRMKIWALHYPVNNIPEPENKILISLNGQSSEINFKQDKLNENVNTSPKTEKNNDTKDNKDIKGPDNNN